LSNDVQELGPGFKGVSADVWSQLLDFVKTVGDDLTGYSDEEACKSCLYPIFVASLLLLLPHLFFDSSSDSLPFSLAQDVE
jgi:hypothetical protein